LSQVRMLIRHATEEPRPLREVNPEVPAGLATVVARMLAKDPAQRFQTPGQAARSVAFYLESDSRDMLPPALGMVDYLQWLEDSPVAAPDQEPEDDEPASAPLWPLGCVGQAFQPDSSKRQAGKPDLRAEGLGVRGSPAPRSRPAGKAQLDRSPGRPEEA